jgi:RNA polymerase sigma-70 factor (ECF subfamily)
VDDSTLGHDFQTLFDQHGRAVYAHIIAMVPNKHDAAEVFQETSTTLWEKFAEYQPETDFRAWACKIAYFKVLSLRKRQFRLPRLLSPESLELVDRELVESAVELDARSAALAKCREKLSQSDRGLLVSYYKDGATANSVAKQRGWSSFQVYRALARVHDILFDCINRRLAEDAHG